METKVLGDKNVFAVEFSFDEERGSAHFGACGLWISGCCLRDASAPVCLETVALSLRGLANAGPMDNPNPVIPSTPSELLAMMQGQGLSEVERHYFLALEGFDDFLKLFFKQQHSTLFLVGLHPDVAALSAYAEFPKRVVGIEVPNDVVNSVAEQFEHQLLQLN